MTEISPRGVKWVVLSVFLRWHGSSKGWLESSGNEAVSPVRKGATAVAVSSRVEERQFSEWFSIRTLTNSQGNNGLLSRSVVSGSGKSSRIGILRCPLK